MHIIASTDIHICVYSMLQPSKMTARKEHSLLTSHHRHLAELIIYFLLQLAFFTLEVQGMCCSTIYRLFADMPLVTVDHRE